jgi:hypothetical protein
VVEIPKAAQAHTPEGAEAFVKFFVEQSNVAWTKPQGGLLPQFSDPGCIACNRLEKTAEELVAKGHRYVAPPISNIRTDAIGPLVHGRQTVRLQAHQDHVKVVDRGGGEVRTDPAMDIARTVVLVWGDGEWQVFDAQ